MGIFSSFGGGRETYSLGAGGGCCDATRSLKGISRLKFEGHGTDENFSSFFGNLW